MRKLSHLVVVPAVVLSFWILAACGAGSQARRQEAAAPHAPPTRTTVTADENAAAAGVDQHSQIPPVDK